MFLLEEIEKQLEIKSTLEAELKSIREGRVDHKRLQAELNALLKWCERVKIGDETEPSWKEKRDHLRMLGIVAYVYPKQDTARKDRYDIRIAPKGLLDVLNEEKKGKLGDIHPD